MSDRTPDISDSEWRLRAVLEAAVDAIITIDRKGVVQSFNRAAENMFGYDADEVVGRNINMLMPQPYRDEHDQYLHRYQQTGEARIIGIGREVVAQRKDGSTFPVDLAVSEIPELQMYTGMIRDLSERKEAEQRLRQADRLTSIGTLAAGLGHDMNNVLLPVRSRLDLIEKTDLPDVAREQFVEIRKAAKYLQDLADGLHLLALDPDDPDASTETTDLNEWWTQTRTLLARALPKHVAFAADIAEELPPIRIAPHRLTQAVLNMLVNSAKAVDKNGSVQLTAESIEDDLAVQLSIADNGCGMTEEVKRRALEPFFTTQTRGLGTGLGLSLVHGVVLAAGGAVDIRSTPGRGTTVVLNFPAAARSDIETNGDTSLVAAVDVANERTRSLIHNLLEMSGVELADEPNGNATIAIVDAQRASDWSQRAEFLIALGDAPVRAANDRILVVDNPNDFDALRAALDEAIERATS